MDGVFGDTQLEIVRIGRRQAGHGHQRSALRLPSPHRSQRIAYIGHDGKFAADDPLLFAIAEPPSADSNDLAGKILYLLLTPVQRQLGKPSDVRWDRQLA